LVHGYKRNGNDSFVQPIRDYYVVIAPTQMIYYNGSQFPSLTDNFLVGSFNRGHIYGLKLYENLTKILETEIFFPFSKHDSVIALAQSKTGQIYFGGYEIRKLKALDLPTKRQISYPISLNVFGPVSIKKLDYNPDNMSISIEVGAIQQNNSQSRIVINIPKSLLSGIYSVVTNQKTAIIKSEADSILGYKIENSRGGFPYTTVDVRLNPNMESKISILGAKPLNPYGFESSNNGTPRTFHNMESNSPNS
jgi:hypothetical protein